MSITPPDNREEQITRQAMERPPAERAAFLEATSAGDTALLKRVVGRLRAKEAAAAPQGTVVDPNALRQRIEARQEAQQTDPAPDEHQNALAQPPDPRQALTAEERPGAVIGRYRLLEKIGEGGFGTVYAAEQREPVKRRVALKVIKLGMDTRQVVARFEAERQALAMMDHPNIAKVLEAGATDTGRPYFVMELVRGIKITQYCDDNHLSTKERLDLFIKVAQAVQHAHQKGVIHRDLKPSNILVADHDGVSVPKIIDFGIAKATTDQRLTDKTLFTAFEQFIGTPAYMSPEQARMSGLDIDTRTDIYSLGVLLYELLTGKTPIDAKDLLTAGLDHIRRTICEQEPARPSTRLSTMLEGELTATAKHRRIEPPKLVHLVRGDLDWIVMKALEKDRARRYQTAYELGCDVSRHLDNQTVDARPPSFLYVAQKFLKRHKRSALAGALCGGLVISVLVGGVQVKRIHALNESARIGLQRQEESEVLTKYLAGLRANEADETSAAKACVARLAARIRSGLGSPLDHDLLARVICLGVQLQARPIQLARNPSVELVAVTGRFDIEGLGAIVMPDAALDNVEVQASEFPCFISGKGDERGGTGTFGKFQLQNLNHGPGVYRFTCALKVQLVRSAETGAHGNVTTANYVDVGSPTRIVLPRLDCLLVDELPSTYPIEIRDVRKSEAIRQDFSVTEAWIATTENNKALLHLNLRAPIISESLLPLALRIDINSIGSVQLQTKIANWMAYESGSVGIEQFQNGGKAESISGIAGNRAKLDFLLPEQIRLGAEKPLRGIITVRSSKEDALQVGLERFLMIPEFQREFLIERHEKPGQ